MMHPETHLTANPSCATRVLTDGMRLIDKSSDSLVSSVLKTLGFDITLTCRTRSKLVLQGAAVSVASQTMKLHYLTLTHVGTHHIYMHDRITLRRITSCCIAIRTPTTIMDHGCTHTCMRTCMHAYIKYSISQ